MKAIDVIALPSIRAKMLRGRYNNLRPAKRHAEINRLARRQRLMDLLEAFAPEATAATLYPHKSRDEDAPPEATGEARFAVE